MTEISLIVTLNNQFTYLTYLPHVDLFASSLNKQTDIYCSWVNDPQALGIDALTLSWQNMFAYAYPPMSYTKDSAAHEKNSLSDNYHSPFLAEETLVSDICNFHTIVFIAYHWFFFYFRIV